MLSFDQAMRAIRHANNRHLLLGNGFSIALKPDIFSYGSLYDNADFKSRPHIPNLFEALKTKDFEIVIHYLQNAAKVVEVYRPSLRRLALRLRADAEAIKTALVSAVAKRHPDRPYDITNTQYVACRKFLYQFKHIYTLNYDVLLYWALMHTEVDDLNLKPDDGFRHPEDDPDRPYVSWQQADAATVHYLHGALHLFDRGDEITKYTWSKTDKAIVDQIREALDDDRFPLFVSEGSTESKKQRILHNAYLHKALRSFESCCKPAKNAIVIYGHSLARNDKHILRCIAAGGVEDLVIGLYGDPDNSTNLAIQKEAKKLVDLREKRRSARYPLRVTYFDAASAKVWG